MRTVAIPVVDHIVADHPTGNSKERFTLKVHVSSMSKEGAKFVEGCIVDQKMYAAPCRRHLLLIYDIVCAEADGKDVTEFAGKIQICECALGGKIYAARCNASSFLISTLAPQKRPAQM